MGRAGFDIAVGQIASVRGDVARNLELIGEAAERAREQGAEHVVFPELAVTGYLIDQRFPDVALRLDSAEVATLKDISRGIDLTVGFIEETPKAIFYNSALHLSQGRIVHLHRKIYLPTYGRFDERRYFGAGWDASAFETPFAKMAILICGDAWHLPLAYLAAHDGADVLLILAASSHEGLADTTPCREAWHWMCRCYALTLSCFVVFANHAAGDDQYHFWGDSFIVGPDGNIIAESKQEEPDLVLARIDLKSLRRQRIQLPFRRDDSLSHTVQLGQRILRNKVRRDQFLVDYGQVNDIPPHPR